MGDLVTRRQVLSVGLLAGGTAAFGSWSLTSCSAGPPTTSTTSSSGARPSPAELRQPPVIRSSRGVLTTRLTPAWRQADIGVGRPVTTYNYDGTIPGPTWELRAGDTLAVEVVNEMPAVAPGPHTHVDHGTDLTRPHAWTNTNLHTHGLHVSSAGNEDNPFISIAPGQRQQYEIHLPDDHQAGFFWYHPHRHGGVTQQVRGGMAGAMIVRGDLDEQPQVAAAAEKVLVLQAIELGPEFTLETPIPDPDKSEAFFPRTQIFWTVNGTYRPKITMYPGEVQRWRIVNAAEGKLASLRLAGHDLHQIAWDGMTLAAPEAATDTLLSPGNRVEVLVKAGRPGSYELVLSPASSQKPFVAGMPTTAQPTGTSGTVSAELVPRLLATVEVRGSGPEMQLPAALPAYDPPMLPVARTRDVGYTVHRLADRSFVSFGINGRPFNPDDPPYQMTLGTAEEWTVRNAADEGFVHVFHVHVNPFKVIRINGVTLDKPLWRDTFVLGPALGDSFTFVTNLTDFTGKFVEHCHVLAHEDLGMMEAVEIVP